MTLFEMKANHLFHIEYSVNENMPDDDLLTRAFPIKCCGSKSKGTTPFLK